MRFIDGVVCLLASILVLGSLGGAMYVSAFHAQEPSWEPFVWGTIVGLLLLGWIHSLGAHRTQLALGAILIVAAIGGSLTLSAAGDSPLTWTPFIWSGLVGFVAAANSYSALAQAEKKRGSW